MNSIFLEKPQEAVLSWLQHSVALKYEGDSSFKKRVFTGSAVQASSIPKTDGSRKLVAAQVSQRVQSLSSSAFSGCTALSSVEFSGAAELSSVGNYAFYRCAALKSIDLPASCKDVGQNCFAESSISRISFGGTKTIGNFAFQSCWSLGAVSLENAREVGEYSFARLNLSVVRFGESLRTLKKYAFYGCQNLADVWFDGDMPSCAESVFTGAKAGCVAHIRQDRDWDGLQPGDIWQGMTVQFQES